MQQPENKRAITRDRYDAVLLDLDGVITDTASIHAACWKQMFDEYLQKRATRRGEAFRPFDIATDDRLYVDGKPRYDGVRDFTPSNKMSRSGASPIVSGIHRLLTRSSRQQRRRRANRLAAAGCRSERRAGSRVRRE